MSDKRFFNIGEEDSPNYVALDHIVRIYRNPRSNVWEVWVANSCQTNGSRSFEVTKEMGEFLTSRFGAEYPSGGGSSAVF